MPWELACAALSSYFVNGVLEDEGARAGVLVLENVEGGALLRDNVAVAPVAQGKAYGRVLVAFAEAEARRRGHAQLRLYTHVLMMEHLALYRSTGDWASKKRAELPREATSRSTWRNA